MFFSFTEILLILRAVTTTGYMCLCRGHVVADVVWQTSSCSFQRWGSERSV